MRGSVVAVVTWLLSAMTSSAAGQEAMTSPSPKRVLPESHAKRLYDDKLEKSTYKKLIRPVDNTSESLTVRIGLRLTSIIDVVSQSVVIIGGGAYWAGRAAARPLFGSCGPPLSLARALVWAM